MSALDKFKQEQQTLDTSQALTLRLDALEEQTRELTKEVNAVSGSLRAMDEAQTAELKRARTSISRLPEQSSSTQVDDETKSRLSEIEKTHAVVAKQLSASGVVKLSDGSEVKRSDLDSFSMMKSLQSRLETTTTPLDELAAQVKAKSHVTLNAEKVADVMSRRQHGVQEPVQGLWSDLEGFREEMTTLGSQKLTEVRTAVEESLSSLSETRRNIEATERRVTFVGISRLDLAVLPLFASLLLVGGLVWGLGSMFGIGPLFGWAWGTFIAASAWWAKALIAAATLAGAALFVWLVMRVSQWIYDELR